MADLDALKERLAALQETMAEYYGQSPCRRAQEHVDRARSELESWADSARGQLEADHAGLDHAFKEIRDLEVRVTELDQRLEAGFPHPHDEATIHKYNECVAERNALVEKHKQRASVVQSRQEDYNRRVDDFNHRFAERREALEQCIAAAQQDVEAYQAWLTDKGDERFFVRLNGLYADLRCLEPDAAEERAELEGTISKVQEMRAALAQHALTDSPGVRSGMLIVPVVFGAGEVCHLLVDNASSVVSLSAELVRALRWKAHVGEEVELSLPAGLTARVPQLLIPRLTVDGREAAFVKGVVMQGPAVGVDGCLGLSFLNRFSYRIDKQEDPRLILQPQRRAQRVSEFDVFISFSSKDISAAKRVYEFLSKSDRQPFLSAISLQKLGSSEFQKAIDQALEDATHMVVICSGRKMLESRWVEAEWRLFDGLRRAGKKQGNIIPVLTGTMTVDDLPLGLSRYATCSLDDVEWKEQLLRYLPK